MPSIVLAPARRTDDVSLTTRLVATAQIRWQSYSRKRLAKSTIRTLHALDDRTLKDIGLDRSEIESAVATGCADRRPLYAA